MTYTLTFNHFGLWELQVVGTPFRRRFYRTRDAAMKTVTRYRRMLQSEADRYEAMEDFRDYECRYCCRPTGEKNSYCNSRCALAAQMY
jgi:hypothetical protein